MGFVRSEFSVTLVVDAAARRTGAMRGRVESCYGHSAFSGWLDLLGQLEALVDRAHDDAATARRERTQPGDGSDIT